MVVNTVLDALYPVGSGVVSLRNAVAIANSSATSTTITFSPTVFATPQTIVLSGNALQINKATTITGPASGLKISGGDEAFAIEKGAVAALSGLTLTKNLDGIQNNGGTLTLSHVTISGILRCAGDGRKQEWVADREGHSLSPSIPCKHHGPRSDVFQHTLTG